MNQIKILIVDDHEMVRRGLRTIIGEQKEFKVVDEACNGAEAIAKAKKFEPDVILMDQRLPDMSGIEAMREVLASVPSVRTLVVTAFEDEEDVLSAVKSGAVGYLLKSASPKEIFDAIRKASNGQPVMSLFATQAMMRQIVTGHVESEGSFLSQHLTPREKEILQLMAEGLTNRELSKKLWISEKTVKTHVSSILHKLGQKSRAQAVIQALHSGIIREHQKD
ncbi:MAG: response regulator transcription factor [Actinomycetota bacterium]